MTDNLHLGKTTTVVSTTLEPTFKLLSHQAETVTKVVTQECDLFMTMHQHTSHWLLSKLSATVKLFN